MFKRAIGLGALIAVASATVSLPAEARPGDRNDRSAHAWRDNDRNWEPSRSYQKGNYKDRRLSRNDRIYRGKDGRAYCRRSDGTTGLVVGAVGGALLAKLVGGNTLGTLAGGAGGALLGRSIDRGDVKCR